MSPSLLTLFSYDRPYFSGLCFASAREKGDLLKPALEFTMVSVKS